MSIIVYLHNEELKDENINERKSMNHKEFDGIKVEEAPEGTVPKCPFCNKRLEKVWLKKKGFGILEQKQIVMCPYCQSLLGYGVFGAR